LRIADCHAEPESRVQLEIPRRPQPVLLWQHRRVFRQRHSPYVIVARSAAVGIEEQRRLIVADVLVARTISLFGTENPFSLAALQSLLADRCDRLSDGDTAEQQRAESYDPISSQSTLGCSLTMASSFDRFCVGFQILDPRSPTRIMLPWQQFRQEGFVNDLPRTPMTLVTAG
jgi:hypothetical protein